MNIKKILLYIMLLSGTVFAIAVLCGCKTQCLKTGYWVERYPFGVDSACNTRFTTKNMTGVGNTNVIVDDTMVVMHTVDGWNVKVKYDSITWAN